MKPHILVIEDDRALLSGLKINLEAEGFRVTAAGNGKTGLEAVEKHPSGIDLVLLDIMLPDISGFELIRDIRALCPGLPVLFLTARNDIYDKISGFTLGADDYITKPFDVRELVLRIRARLKARPDAAAAAEPFEMGDLRIDPGCYKVFKTGVELDFTRMEFEILLYLYRNRGLVISRNQLLEKLWGLSADVTTRTVDMHIGKIRKKIEDDVRNPKYIVTVFGVGYRLEG